MLAAAWRVVLCATRIQILVHSPQYACVAIFNHILTILISATVLNASSQVLVSRISSLPRREPRHATRYCTVVLIVTRAVFTKAPASPNSHTSACRIHFPLYLQTPYLAPDRTCPLSALVAAVPKVSSLPRFASHRGSAVSIGGGEEEVEVEVEVEVEEK